MNSTRLDQRGSVLIIAVIAMLILGILSFSFALLSRVEMTTGVNYKFQAQAEALAEAGLERGRDEVRTAADQGCGFTQWTDPGNSSSYPGCGAGLAKLLFNGTGLGAGTYSAVIDNDCSPLVPVAIQDPSCSGGSPARDTNETAVLTAWGTAANGQGRARVRGVLGIDNPWKHVCSNSSQDNPPGYCNEPANRNGNPTIVPADPNEYPGGPAAYDELPRPQLGCSAIDVTLHGETVGNCPPGQNYGYPYPSGKRLVIAGDRSKANCDGRGDAVPGVLRLRAEHPMPECHLRRRRPRRLREAGGHPHGRQLRQSHSTRRVRNGRCDGHGVHVKPHLARQLRFGRQRDPRVRHAPRGFHDPVARPLRHRRRRGERVVRLWREPGSLAQERLEDLDRDERLRIPSRLSTLRSG